MGDVLSIDIVSPGHILSLDPPDKAIKGYLLYQESGLIIASRADREGSALRD